MRAILDPLNILRDQAHKTGKDNNDIFYSANVKNLLTIF